MSSTIALLKIVQSVYEKTSDLEKGMLFSGSYLLNIQILEFEQVTYNIFKCKKQKDHKGVFFRFIENEEITSGKIIKSGKVIIFK